MTVHVVVDQSGAGRIVGVFEDRSRAEEVIGDFHHYYKLYSVELNRVDPAVLGWTVNEDQRTWLARFLDEK